MKPGSASYGMAVLYCAEAFRVEAFGFNTYQIEKDILDRVDHEKVVTVGSDKTFKGGLTIKLRHAGTSRQYMEGKAMYQSSGNVKQDRKCQTRPEMEGAIAEKGLTARAQMRRHTPVSAAAR